ncbi:hypothetical protein AV530_009359 [Patagioenas fasciata monilis]|uniref:Uncharacterized protein n=1 Tax=Patagioenas fasciata monilis TaxID=372326 RepID=A0A1V4JIQ0_PATFA|nr:hypothetical protein AV530_009359 [Patagioenas fasciata monilis]
MAQSFGSYRNAKLFDRAQASCSGQSNAFDLTVCFYGFAAPPLRCRNNEPGTRLNLVQFFSCAQKCNRGSTEDRRNYLKRVLPSFRLKQREDEKCRARESLTAENHCLLCCSPGQRRACV